MSIRIEDLDRIDLDEVVDTGEPAIPPTRPGDILRHDFMEPLDLRASELARALGVPANRITAILNGQRRISADTALRLARHFGTTPELWLNLQDRYDLAATIADHGDEIERTVSRRERLAG